MMIDFRESRDLWWEVCERVCGKWFLVCWFLLLVLAGVVYVEVEICEKVWRTGLKVIENKESGEKVGYSYSYGNMNECGGSEEVQRPSTQP